MVLYYGFMSAPITHIVLAEKVFEKYFAGKERNKFIIGTSFPDIRRLANIDRGLTHFEDLQIEEITGESSFMSGFHFHSVVDRLMKKFRKENSVLSYFPESKYATEAEKVFEDSILCKKMGNWKEISEMFEVVLDEELQFGTEKEVVKSWHTKLQEYFLTMPDYRHVLGGFVTGPMEISEEIIRVVDNVRDKEKLIGLIEDFYDNFS